MPKCRRPRFPPPRCPNVGNHRNTKGESNTLSPFSILVAFLCIEFNAEILPAVFVFSRVFQPGDDLVVDGFFGDAVVCVFLAHGGLRFGLHLKYYGLPLGASQDKNLN